MKQISPAGQKWLKSFHLLFTCLWTGGAASLTLMFFFIKADDGMQLYGITQSMKFIDDFIIIPGALGCLLTGILYSSFTKWGWFRHNWITVKWCITVYGVVFGTFCLGPWMNSLPPIAKAEGMAALSNAVYTHNLEMLYCFGTFQACTLVFALFVSSLKPWRGNKP
ncbi:MAG: hypothetical protein MUC95_05210 [Spirochaetes bacterium]|jgi:uncharacterized membrane protein|nr:hypothetical protein [Spirochaetota bacterium]